MAPVSREDGFTLAELLVVIAVLGMIMAAVLVIYMKSEEIYARSSSLEEAQVGARAGVNGMATELRLIGAYWVGAAGAGNAITAATPTQITFVADVDGDTLDNTGAEVTLGADAAAGSKTITVDRTAGWLGTNAFAAGEWVYVGNGIVREVIQIRVNYGGGTDLPVENPWLLNSYSAGDVVRSVESVTYAFDAGANTLTRSVGGGGPAVIVDNVTGLTLSYFDQTGTALPASPDVTLVWEIQISLTTAGPDGGGRLLTTRVRPRNLSFQ